MSFFLHHSNWFFINYYPECIWKVDTKSKIIYLTFDDGPTPDVTNFVLDTLRRYNAKATFFCIGKNIENYKEIFKQILEQGHAVGNHTFDHLNGWKNNDEFYFQNTAKCQSTIAEVTNTDFFRPPYGRIKKSQIKHLIGKHKIIMWTVLSGDFEPTLSPNYIFKKSIKYTTEGSIVVFHDSIKAFENLKIVLPLYLKHFDELGYKFEKLTHDLF